MDITNLDTYNARMSSSIEDKMWFWDKVKNQKPGGERQCTVLCFSMLTLQKGQQKRPGAIFHHARPLGSRIGWRENESRKARVNRSCGE